MKLSTKILLPILIFITVCLSISGVYTYFQTKNKLVLNMVNGALDSEMNTMVDSIKNNEDIKKLVQEELNRKNIGLAKSVSELIAGNKALLATDKMIELAKKLNVSEICVTNEKGVIVGGSIAEFNGFDFNYSEQTKAFLPAITDKNFTLAQAPTPRGSDKSLFQYIGVSRTDEPGVVQIGIEPKTIDTLTKSMELQILTEKIHIGKNGYAYIVDENGTALAHKSKEKIGQNIKPYDWSKEIFSKSEGKFTYTFNGVFNYSAFKKMGSYIIVMVYPESEFITQLNALRNTNIAALIISILILVGSISFIVRIQITKRLDILTKTMEKAGNGELTTTIEIKGKDEIGLLGYSFNKMIGNMKNLILEVKENSTTISQNTDTLSSVSEEMSSSASEVSNAVQSMASGTSIQADHLAQIAGSLNEFGNNLEEIVNLTETTNSNALLINKQAQESNGTMASLSHSIASISNSFKGVSFKINELGTNINKINDITSLINDIADQTNLLALNAAIEAARAGDAGKGFAVVAEEIRKLAEQSKMSSENISILVNNISKETNLVVSTTETVNSELSNQVTTVETSIHSFKEIINAIENIIPQIEKITNSALDINKEKDSIIEKVDSSFAVAEQNSATTEEIAASSEQLDASSQEVASTASMLKDMNTTMMTSIEKFTL